jgi:hypothetical protein
MCKPSARCRIAGLLGSVVFPLFVVQGCAHVVRVPRGEYPTVPGRKGTAVIHTSDGRIYEFHGVGQDSSRFVGRIDVTRSVVGRDGHLDMVEDTREVRLPFSEVTSVEMRSTSVVNSALAVAGGAGLIYMLIKQFAPASSTSGSTTPGDPAGQQSPAAGRAR